MSGVIERRCGVKTIFIAGTDTGVGKTVVTLLLARYLRESGYSVSATKWAVTGYAGGDRDELGGRALYRFKFPASPHLAARLEKRRINADKIINSTKALSRRFDFVVVEGIGGLMVPLNEKILLIDLIKMLKIPVLLVAANKLGVINHALLSIEALRRRNIEIIGTIFNNLFKNEDRIILEDNPKIIEKFSGVKTIGVLPYAENLLILRTHFVKIGDRIIARL